jgi:hypothetical protein
MTEKASRDARYKDKTGVDIKIAASTVLHVRDLLVPLNQVAPGQRKRHWFPFEAGTRDSPFGDSICGALGEDVPNGAAGAEAGKLVARSEVGFSEIGWKAEFGCDCSQLELFAEFVKFRRGGFALIRALGERFRKKSLEQESAVPGIEAASGVGVVPIGQLDFSFQFVAFGHGVRDQILKAAEVLARQSLRARAPDFVSLGDRRWGRCWRFLREAPRNALVGIRHRRVVDPGTVGDSRSG